MPEKPLPSNFVAFCTIIKAAASVGPYDDINLQGIYESHLLRKPIILQEFTVNSCRIIGFYRGILMKINILFPVICIAGIDKPYLILYIIKLYRATPKYFSK